ncbi:hypothetical protein Tco_0948791 [Tanacetum coccineum]
MSQPANDEFSQHLSDEESNHEDASDTGAAPKQPQPMIPQTTAISNIKLPILKKEEYDIWAMEMEHYLEYIDNEVWKVIQNGNSKKRISIGKDGVVRVLSPVTAAEIQAVEKERKAKNILLMAIPKEHMRRFHGMDDAKEIWEAIRTRFGGNANSKKMQKAVFKQQFEAFRISNSEGLEKGYDRFQQLLSQLEAHGAEVSTEDANHKFLRSLPSAWSNLAMTMRTNPEIDNLSIDDLYNNLRVFEQEIQAKAALKGESVFLCYSTCTLLILQPKIPEKRSFLLFFADRSTLSLFANKTEGILVYFMKILEQLDDVDIEESDINWQIAMIAISDEEKLEVLQCHNTGHIARIYSKGDTKMERRREEFTLSTSSKLGARENHIVIADKDDGIVNWENILKVEEQIQHFMAISLTMSQAVKKLEAQLVTSQRQQLSLNEKLTFQVNEIHEKDEKLKRYRRIGMKAVREKEQLQKIVDSWKDSFKESYGDSFNSGMSSHENCSKEDSIGKPLYSRFTKTNDFKGVPHPLSGDYTPKPQEEIDDSLRLNHKEYVIQMRMSTVDNVVSELQEVEPSCVKHVKTPRQPLKDKDTHNVNRKNWNDMMERERGEGYSFTKKKCFVYGSLSHLIKDCDYYEKKMTREVEVKRVVNTGNGVAKPVWTNANKIIMLFILLLLETY